MALTSPTTVSARMPRIDSQVSLRAQLALNQFIHPQGLPGLESIAADVPVSGLPGHGVAIVENQFAGGHGVERQLQHGAALAGFKPESRPAARLVIEDVEDGLATDFAQVDAVDSPGKANDLVVAHQFERFVG